MFNNRWGRKIMRNQTICLGGTSPEMMNFRFVHCLKGNMSRFSFVKHCLRPNQTINRFSCAFAFNLMAFLIGNSKWTFTFGSDATNILDRGLLWKSIFCAPYLAVFTFNGNVDRFPRRIRQFYWKRRIQCVQRQCHPLASAILIRYILCSYFAVSFFSVPFSIYFRFSRFKVLFLRELWTLLQLYIHTILQHNRVK